MWRVYYGAKRMMRSAAVTARGRAITPRDFADEASALSFVAECRKSGVSVNEPTLVKELASA
jgi:hypothetical protein